MQSEAAVTYPKVDRVDRSLEHPDLCSLDERLDYLLTTKKKKKYAKARLTEISVLLNDLIGHWL